MRQHKAEKDSQRSEDFWVRSHFFSNFKPLHTYKQRVSRGRHFPCTFPKETWRKGDVGFLVLKLGALSSAPGSFTAEVRSGHPLNRRLGERAGQSERFGEKKLLLILHGIIGPQSSGLPARSIVTIVTELFCLKKLYIERKICYWVLHILFIANMFRCYKISSESGATDCLERVGAFAVVQLYSCTVPLVLLGLTDTELY